MKPILIATLAACLLTTACGGSKGAGALRIEPLPATVTRACRHPSEFLGGGDWEVIAGRLGDELIACGAQLDTAVEAHEKLRKALQ